MSGLQPIDPDVKLPPAVARAIAKGTDIHAQVYLNGGDPAATETDAAEGPAPAAADPAPERTFTPAPEQPFTQPAITQAGNDGIDWKHRFESMKGRYDAEVPRLREQLSDAARANVALESRISDLEAVLAGTGERAASAKPLLTDQEREEYGADFLNVVGKRAKEEVIPEVEALKQEVAALKRQLSNVSGHVEQSTRESLLKALDAKIPRWREVNEDPEFLSWLSLPDPFSGVIRHMMLTQAFERNDAPRVAAFFTGFLAQEAAVGPGNTPEPDQGKQPERVPLDKFAAPGRAKSAATTTVPAEKPFITRSEIEQFYADVRRGAYKGREDEKDRIEREISAAAREGRVR